MILKNKIIVIVSFLMILSILQVNAFKTNGSNKIFEFVVTSGKNTDLSSSNFRTYLDVGDIGITAASSSFKTELGFSGTMPYLDGESCQNEFECVGGFCCSNVCRSSSCPVDEAPPPGDGAGAGGGGLGFALKKKDFTIDKDLITISIKQGGTYKTKFTIKNIGTEELSFDIDASDLENLLWLSDTQFTLSPDEAKDIEVTIFVAEEKKPDIYSGNIKIKADNIVKSLLVIIEAQARKPLFDIIVQVLPQYKNVLKTENVVANITLINVGDLKPVDVELYYAIRDIEGNDLMFGFETLAVYDKVFRLKELELPSNISFGAYIFYSKVTYGIETAAAGDVFYVVSEKPATCFDGIQNQNEKGIDCGGPCKPCKLRLDLLLFISKYKLFIISILIIIVIIFLISKLEKEEERIEELTTFINLALNKGHQANYIRTMLLSKGLPKEIVDNELGKIISDKLKKSRKLKFFDRKKQIVKPATMRLPKKLNKELVDYINKALNLGYTPNEIKKRLLGAGWPENVIKEHISEAVQSISRKT